jgi:hypothetical protein
LFVYVDESGDLGFSEKSTKFFVVSYLILETPHVVEHRMKKLLKKLHKRGVYAKGQCELKHSNSNQHVRISVLEELCKCEMNIGYIVLEKEKVYDTLRGNPNILYNYFIVHTIMINIVPKLNSSDKLVLILDKSLSGHSKEAFNIYARSKASWVAKINEKEYPIELSSIKIKHLRSHDEPCLQAVDFLAGTCFQKYERGNETNFQLIESKIEYFNYYWE